MTELFSRAKICEIDSTFFENLQVSQIKYFPRFWILLLCFIHGIPVSGQCPVEPPLSETAGAASEVQNVGFRWERIFVTKREKQLVGDFIEFPSMVAPQAKPMSHKRTDQAASKAGQHMRDNILPGHSFYSIGPIMLGVLGGLIGVVIYALAYWLYLQW